MSGALLCINCGTPLRRTFVNLGSTPISNFNVRPEDISKPDPTYPLHVRICESCLLVQAEGVVDRSAHFGEDYQYFSSFAASWVEHARRYAEDMIARFGLSEDSMVVEVASNDGYLLQHFVARGVPVLGVEPTKSTANAAIAKGIPTEMVFFGRATAERLTREGYAADLMASNNVLAHVPDINDFVAGFATLLKPEGVWTVEFPHILNLIEENQFDTIYHEHYSYLSLLVVERILTKHGLRVFNVEELRTHGGSLRVFSCHRDAHQSEAPGLARVRAKEADFGLDSLGAYEGFDAKVQAAKKALLAFLNSAKAEGKTVAAYGAAAKGNTLLNYCGVGTDLVAYVVDRNDKKQGRYLPGSRLPILAPEKIAETKPDYVLILPWNLRREIEAQMGEVRQWGGKFVVAIPKLEVF
ncbi:MAG: class I SAM-dependent methyltransferase [Hyphomicrobium sp.]|uniref:class I SAM-dependent methyltransferase n=1 Tax=Hyphomicrobium sp. TaxID=82 RepID=UPI00132C0F77|nr:class I SAM-dependent methyltransferase [Hyphomicrobium sp.]KAB2938996.1 MAG: class I SAM-dependent methyltransferase [Hyphomicrobium sp.]MBZ0211778.1 class I SAM-dependent methyltransferase [Hyphomicrobium sp.]